MKIVIGVSQLFHRRIEDGYIAMVLEKVTDDISFVGTKIDMEDLAGNISQRLKVNETIIDGPIDLKGFRIVQDVRRDIVMDISAYNT